MRKLWKSAVALMCAGTLLLTGCGAGKGSSSESGTSKDGVTSLTGADNGSAEAAVNDAESSMEAYGEETAVKIGIPAAKADPESPDKEETVYVKADAGGSVNEVKVDNVLHVYDTDEVTDVSELDDIHNTEGTRISGRTGVTFHGRIWEAISSMRGVLTVKSLSVSL